MTSFTVLLADIPVGINAIYPSTKSFLKDYITDAEPAFEIIISEEDIAYEQRQSVLQYERNGRMPHRYSESYLETLSVLRKIADRLIKYNTILFHGVAVVADNYAYIFTAPSGTGKTTHARLWLDQVSGSYILNGDKPFLRVYEDRVTVYGSPWQGKESYGCNKAIQLKGICLLERDTRNHIRTITLSDAFSVLIHQTYRPENEMIGALDIVYKIGGMVDLYRLRCNMDPEAARISAECMLRIKNC